MIAPTLCVVMPLKQLSLFTTQGVLRYVEHGLRYLPSLFACNKLIKNNNPGGAIAQCKVKYPQDPDGLNLRPFWSPYAFIKNYSRQTGVKMIRLYCQDERGLRTMKPDLRISTAHSIIAPATLKHVLIVTLSFSMGIHFFAAIASSIFLLTLSLY